MLTILEDIKDYAETLLADLRDDVVISEGALIRLLQKAEHAIGYHKSATEEPSAPEPSPEPKEILPAGYPPITPS